MLCSLDLKPKDCVAVAEVEVELLTGRTHQIRGQLATMGFPLCGDSLYGGVLSELPSMGVSKPSGYLASDYLCLQCCELSFCNPCEEKRMNTFRLEEAWWSTWLKEYNENPEVESTTSVEDDSAEIKRMQISNIRHAKTHPEKDDAETSDNNILNIPLLQLSPGQNKYVIIKASGPEDTEPIWLIRYV